MARTHSRSSTQKIPESDETQKGHMKQQCQNVRSTKVKQNATDNQEEETHKNKPQAKHKDVYIKIYVANDTAHSNQTNGKGD